MNKKKVIFSSVIANIFEWYDYILFVLFAKIIGSKFFPAGDPSMVLLKAFLVFAVGYLMRPIGGIIFGVIGDKYGRKVALSTSVLCMAFPTAIIGFMPTYETIGVTATIIMVGVRMLQGLSMGGALTGSVSFLIEHTDKKSRGFIGSLPMASICIGILLGSLVYHTTKSSLSDEQFIDWGWRIPFILGIFIFFSGLYIKNFATETPLFEKIKNNQQISSRPLKDAICQHWPTIILSILINATGSVIFYLEASYISIYLKTYRNFSETNVDNLLNICYLIMVIVVLIVGRLSDIISRRKVFVFNLLLIIILAPWIINTIEYGSLFEIYVAQIALAILAAAYIGPEPALQAEFYPTAVRNTALSISYNTATGLFGGSTLYLIEFLRHKTGSISYTTYYVMTCAIASLIALYFYKDRS